MLKPRSQSMQQLRGRRVMEGNRRKNKSLKIPIFLSSILMVTGRWTNERVNVGGQDIDLCISVWQTRNVTLVHSCYYGYPFLYYKHFSCCSLFICHLQVSITHFKGTLSFRINVFDRRLQDLPSILSKWVLGVQIYAVIKCDMWVMKTMKGKFQRLFTSRL